MKTWRCIAILAFVGPATARSAEAPAKVEAASAWAGYAPAGPWKGHRPESSWRGYEPRAGWKVAPPPGLAALREGGGGRDLVTVVRPPRAVGR